MYYAMKKPLVFVSVIVLSIILPAAVLAEEGTAPLTLSEALGIALRNNHALLSEGEKLKAAHAGVGEASSAFMPKVDVSETYTRSDNPVAVFGSKLNQRRFTASDFAIDSLNNPPPISDWNFRVQVVQPLFNGGKELVGVKRAKLSFESAKMAEERARMETVYQTVQAYWGVALAGEYVNVAEAAMKSTEDHLRLAESLYSQGMLIGSEVLLAKVHLADVKEMLIKAKNREATAKAALNTILARPQETVFALADRLEYREFGGGLKELQDEALKDRPDLASMETGVRNMEEGVTMAKTDYLPNINLVGRYDLDTRNIFGHGGDSYTLMGQLTWNVFDGLLTTNKVRQANAEKNAAAHQYEGMKDAVLFEVRKASYDLDEARQRIDVSKAAVTEGEEGLRIIKRRFEAGMAKTLDVLDAETALTRARTNSVQALYDYNVAIAALKLAVGRKDY
jgi:outer membrane protein